MERDQQPWLHDLVLSLGAPTQVWSARDGQVRRGGAHGVHHGDRRLLAEMLLTVDGTEPTPVAHHAAGGGSATFVAVPRHLGDPGPDPTVRVVRRREVTPGRVRETYTVTSAASDPVTCELGLRVSADLAPLDLVKSGGAGSSVPASGVGTDELTWSGEGLGGVLHAPGSTTSAEGDGVDVTWRVTVVPGGSVSHDVEITLTERAPVTVAPRDDVRWGGLDVTSADRRLGPVVARCLDDLRLLRLAAPADGDRDEEEFVAAGAPWFLTLFGRDSLWTARMLLPVTSALAGSTLRLLARHQGRGIDPTTAEQPGKILHEVRAAGFTLGDDNGVERHLPPVYYGTIDATPLWALTLHDAWRWGLPADEVEALLPALENALTWQVEHGDADGDHLLEYVDSSGHGLANQGWKDSGDSVRHADGSLATAPVALAEVQAYAYAAATRGADLLEAFGRPGTDRWREWAARLRVEFDKRFWVDGPGGPFPAIALDADKQPVASLTSNIGHLLGTGLLDGEGADVVARLLVRPDLLSGFGIRTLSSDAAGYSPTGYHVGSVWPHDTAICLAGLAAEGRAEVAPVAEALLSALDAYDGRPPELFAGDDRAEHPAPLPYPAACRPQAWSAASGISLLTSVLGLSPEGEALSVRPVEPWTFGATRVDGVRVGEQSYVVDVDDDGIAGGRAVG